MDAAIPPKVPSPSLGVDRVEFNVRGGWTKTARERLGGADYGKLRLGGEVVDKVTGGRHGPDFYPFSIYRKDDFRIDVFPQRDSQYAGRFYLFATPLQGKGWQGATGWLRDIARLIGCSWEAEAISRLDLRADIAIPFDEFSRRIDGGCLVTRMRRKPAGGKTYPTTRYFGTKRFIRLRIYDKVRETLDRQAKQNKGSVTTARNRRLLPNGPHLTRVEFEANRKWLLRQKIDAVADVDLPELWRELCEMFRLTDRPPDGKHYDRCPTWPAWDAIRFARWPELEQGPTLSPKEQSRPPPRCKEI